MDPGVRSAIKSIKFSTYSKEDIEKISIMPITNGQVFDHSGNPIKDGVYDLRLGSTENNQVCQTCGQNAWNCNGHFANIKLTRRVYHPFYVKTLASLLSGICIHCHNTRMPRQLTYQVTDALKLIARGEVLSGDIFSQPEDTDGDMKKRNKEIRHRIKSLPLITPSSYIMQQRAAIIKEFLAKNRGARKCCSNCQHNSPEMRFSSFNFEFQKTVSDSKEPLYMSPDEVYSILDGFYQNNKSFFHEFFSDRGPSIFFIEEVCVPPPKYRPASVLGDKVNAHPSSSSLAEIEKSEIALTRAIDEDDKDAVRKAMSSLQNNVNAFFDNTLAKSTKKLPHGIRQILEKKEGLFRKNLMGKRVNFSARSVIAPDPYISTDEIGVPEVFAKTLSYPERVTEFNKDKLSQLIMNGSEKYPGANFFTSGDGRTVRLHGMTEQERGKYAKMLYANDGNMPIVVGRHAMDGDYVLINRQPTLHRVSILAMRCRILPNQKTIRMHYSNCASFNADFDGDEINLHLPQNELGRSEARNLSLSSIHYVTPTAGNPIRGLIQDHVDSGALLTMKNKFFTKSQYEQLVFAAFSNEPEGRLVMLPPAIILPHQMWTGKQIISTLLINLTKDKEPLELKSNSKFTVKILSSQKEEATVYVQDSELIHGIIDKAQYGASTYGLVHSLFELYGNDLANRFLTMLTRLFTFYMQTHGHTCGIDDMIIQKDAEKVRKDLTEQMVDAAENAAKQFIDEFGNENTKGLPLKQRLMDIINKPGIKDRFDTSQKNAITPFATKIIGEIFPGKLAKVFPDNCLLLMAQSGAKGTVVNVSQIAALLGQQDLEGRRVPLMASCKSLPSFDPMDLSPIAGGFISSRFLTGLKPQEYYFHCMAGREGLTDTAVKTANTGYLQRCIIKHIEGIHAAYDGTVRNSDDSIIEFLYGEDGIDPMNSKYLSTFNFMEDNYKAYLSKLKISELLSKVECNDAMKILDSNEPREDPIQSIFPPHLHVGAVSEKFEEQLKKRCTELNHMENPKIGSENLRAVALFNYFKSVIHPGEVVGVIAAEAIGEPATQMTLNTFHLAGYGGANVTLGIPRLKEVLIVATRTPLTPTMTIPLKTESLEEVEKFVSIFKRVPLREAVSAFTVAEDFHAKSETRRDRQITVSLHFIKDKLKEWNIDNDFQISVLRSKFASTLKKRIAAVFKSTGTKIVDVENDTVATTANTSQKAEEMGADLTKKRTRKTEQNSYENEEDAANAQTNEDDENQDKENETITDENVVAKFDKSTATMTVCYTVGNVNVKVLLESIVEKVLNEVMIYEMPGVSRATYQQNKENGRYTVLTEGANFDKMIERADIIDFNHFYTNNVADILDRFGIEAARAAIIKEVAAVFYSYSISVDSRHLNLIADYVTHTGNWLGMSRHSMKSCSSPLQQMSFETTCQFLTHATLHGETDMMRSPSASLTAGNIVKAGTGLCEILVPFE
ncbi:DNA-directed RNA polymerase I subunit rpa1 [Tritrichomonas foetus]|uniref:DNA-directed RNA polymerase subunit n=1 Tax=Tritrichomonas foetus TaxID=1144522 RepID=A0A1J4JX52_9EUKA|nr:DNA-directed RNA polymerase I subunit rpa1 [Tritrichomonas foetus]|eukprot:OHT03727.1 DNA-directed RNA polymerase I subunit rpa1 [Tritrichomonas foetus]